MWHVIRNFNQTWNLITLAKLRHPTSSLSKSCLLFVFISKSFLWKLRSCICLRLRVFGYGLAILFLRFSLLRCGLDFVFIAIDSCSFIYDWFYFVRWLLMLFVFDFCSFGCDWVCFVDYWWQIVVRWWQIMVWWSQISCVLNYFILVFINLVHINKRTKKSMHVKQEIYFTLK